MLMSAVESAQAYGKVGIRQPLEIPMRIFLASPFTHYLIRDADGSHRLDPDLHALLLRIESALTEAGHSLFLSQRREEFGAKLWSAHQCTPFDFLEMQCSDCVIAIPDKSYGVHVEIGWATAMGKPVLLVVDESAEFTSPLLQGLECVGQTRTVNAGANLLKDVRVQAQLCQRLVQVLGGLSPVVKREACAFLSTSFGFGPVSKAVTIAREMKRQAPHLEVHYFGAGIDYEFARKSGAFDRLLRIDVDKSEVLSSFVPLLKTYKYVVSVINLDILKAWPSDHPPLYLVDSLAWLWPELPPGVNNAKAYFVQSYLMPEQRAQNWREACSLVLVGPIRPDMSHFRQPDVTRKKLLVNFSGCANPFAPPTLFERYVEVLARAIVDQAGSFEEITFCCNEKLSDYLMQLLGDSVSASASYLSHDKFLEALAGSSAVLTSPGITTTLEASALGKPTRFLLPQNYSQALMSEHYRTVLGDRSGMAFSRFASSLAVPADLPEEEGVSRVISSLDEILGNRQEQVHEMISELLADQASEGPLDLPLPHGEEWSSLGQRTIVEYVLSGTV
jgi:nucleoside 2-deoxyribosyltransferase